jgi:hypothetical protein
LNDSRATIAIAAKARTIGGPPWRRGWSSPKWLMVINVCLI